MSGRLKELLLKFVLWPFALMRRVQRYKLRTRRVICFTNIVLAILKLYMLYLIYNIKLYMLL